MVENVLPFVLDCADVQKTVGYHSGVFSVNIEQITRVYCDLVTNEGGWMVSDLLLTLQDHV